MRMSFRCGGYMDAGGRRGGSFFGFHNKSDSKYSSNRNKSRGEGRLQERPGLEFKKMFTIIFFK